MTSSSDNESSKQVPEGCCVNGNARDRLFVSPDLYSGMQRREDMSTLPLWEVDWKDEGTRVCLRILIREINF